MPLPKFLAQLQHLPRGQRLALGGGAAVATGAGLYSYRKKRAAGGTKKPASSSSPVPAPDLSQYGQVAVLVPIDWQAGANFGGSGGLTGGLTPPATPPPVPTPTPPPGHGDDEDQHGEHHGQWPPRPRRNSDHDNRPPRPRPRNNGDHDNQQPPHDPNRPPNAAWPVNPPPPGMVAAH